MLDCKSRGVDSKNIGVYDFTARFLEYLVVVIFQEMKPTITSGGRNLQQILFSHFRRWSKSSKKIHKGEVSKVWLLEKLPKKTTKTSVMQILKYWFEKYSVWWPQGKILKIFFLKILLPRYDAYGSSSMYVFILVYTAMMTPGSGSRDGEPRKPSKRRSQTIEMNVQV